MKSLIALIVLTAVLINAACSPSAASPTAVPEPIYSRATEATLKPGDPIPVPENPILTVSGKIGVTNVGGTLQMDLETIEAVGMVDYTVNEPFGNVRVTYRGPLLSDLLALWGVPDDAEALYVTALDDYAVTISFDDIGSYPIVFALQEDGVYMPITEHGPAMLVWPYDHFEFEPAVYNDYWIWQIKSISVR